MRAQKGPIAGEQASRKWDECRATHRHLRKVRLSLDRLKPWGHVDAELGIVD
jgi:glycine/D-amino acid oxidase-like deaminating enzyme